MRACAAWFRAGWSEREFASSARPTARAVCERRAEEFDVIALDQNMPGLDGLSTLARIHAIANHPPVIFVTGAQDS